MSGGGARWWRRHWAVSASSLPWYSSWGTGRSWWAAVPDSRILCRLPSRSRCCSASAGGRHPSEAGPSRGTLTSRVTGMRVYLGADHAGYEFKQTIIEHLLKTGHEPIDCGAYKYDADDDYPAFCIAAAIKTVGDPDSLGI